MRNRNEGKEEKVERNIREHRKEREREETKGE